MPATIIFLESAPLDRGYALDEKLLGSFGASDLQPAPAATFDRAVTADRFGCLALNSLKSLTFLFLRAALRPASSRGLLRNIPSPLR